MICNCYLRDNLVYVPTVVKTTAGFYQGTEPIVVVPVASDLDLRRALRDALARGNAIVPTPTRDSYTTPPIVKYAKVKSWSAFAKRSALWSIIEENGEYRIVGYQTGRPGGWTEDPDRIARFPAGTAVDAIIERIIAILQQGWPAT